MWLAGRRSSHSLWIVVKWKENNQKWQPAVTGDVEGCSVPHRRWTGWMFEVCVVRFVYSCVVWFSHVQFSVLTWCFLWTKLYVSNKQNLCGMLMLFLTMAMSMEQIYIFKTNAIAELILRCVPCHGSQAMSRWNWPSEIKKPGHML